MHAQSCLHPDSTYTHRASARLYAHAHYPPGSHLNPPRSRYGHETQRPPRLVSAPMPAQVLPVYLTGINHTKNNREFVTKVEKHLQAPVFLQIEIIKLKHQEDCMTSKWKKVFHPTHALVKGWMTRHIAKKQGSCLYHIRVSRLEQTCNLRKSIFFQSNDLTHSTGHLK
ncbi:hypothetical protein GDO81_006199 [Engystomops pustulosus]|uniref:Uncharacterized protein n=1 Tax=Engystomops pustulosus TaxID=76066 RepID=A0AAV7CVK8_ENGPU|nr:hypothetical protein GDO81_006199 [Engystomops pustulosus]